MIEIYSRVDPTQLLHIIHRKRETVPGRLDMIDPEHALQVAVLRPNKGQTYKPHRHDLNVNDIAPHHAYESWVVVSGAVQCILYDIDDTVIHTDILEQGDISVTLAGGHNYVIMGEETIVYEFKTGPYVGIEMDKTMI